jgi:HD-GYP domain-containing protein (c-di-GMP phosphodiesterase class II)
MPQRPPDGDVTLAELMAAFSLATDLGLGQPMEHLLRSWRIADQLARRTAMGETDRSALYYVAVLSWVGCVADTPEVATWFGDDIAFRAGSYDVDFAGLPAMRLAARRAGTGQPAWKRAQLVATLAATGAKAVRQGLVSHCLTTSRLAEQVGLPVEVVEPLQQFFTRWDGRGVPEGIGGADIAASVRTYQLADVVEVYHRNHGVAGAVEVAKARRGTQFDPELVDAFCTAADELLEEATATSPVDLVSAAPGLRRTLTDDELDRALEALADFTDLRSTWRSGHSRRVAALAGAAAMAAGLAPPDVDVVRRAGLVHDIGLHGVPATILDKEGPLTAGEAERLRLHAYYTERMLARPTALARVGAVAGLVRERMDGSGYHRGLSGALIPSGARVLAAADVYCALTEDRPYRGAQPTARAAATLRSEARSGRLDADAVDAVLAAATGRAPARRRTGPAGLTPREVEVLVLIARGASTRQVARALGISPKTAGTHIERIYSKTGASTRSTATLFAVQHGLLDSLEPVDA